MNGFIAAKAIDSLIPISSFSKGGANKIFAEVSESGCKIVLKNNSPACVLMSPQSYRALLDELEDLRLQVLVEERLSNDNGITIPANEVYAELGILSDDNDEISMEYGVDFE